jgi:hypothetical protein
VNAANGWSALAGVLIAVAGFVLLPDLGVIRRMIGTLALFVAVGLLAHAMVLAS